VRQEANSLGLDIGIDLNRDPVYLSGEVIPSTTFARAMLVLGKVVRTIKPAPKDHSAYQRWVEGEYLKLLAIKEPTLKSQLAALDEKSMALKEKRDKIKEQLLPVMSLVEKRKHKFFNWLYKNDIDAWIVLDPIVSVQKDGTFFEAFSGDESIYARVFLPSSALRTEVKPSLGTTNIDFSTLLERELQRVRSYRSLSLNIGMKRVDFKTAAATVEEEKIPLPESWVLGLVEVQSALSLASITFEMSSQALAEIIAKLESEKEKHGPRALRFDLAPNSPIQIVIEPWGYVYSDDWCEYVGKKSETVRIWGRRRLSVLKEILVDTDVVSVRFLGSGMPSFWTVVKDGVELTIGLSGWSENDWASKAKFSAFVPTANVAKEKLPAGLKLIQERGSLTNQDLSKEFSITAQSASAILQKLCLQGKVMYDASKLTYRFRDLFPTLDFYKESESSRQQSAGVAFLRGKKLTLDSIEEVGEVKYLSGSVASGGMTYLPKVELDLDGRPKFAQCTCPFFNYNRLRHGPCEHMIALILSAEPS
jgi:hypothetical protein